MRGPLMCRERASVITRITYIHTKPDLVGWQQDCPGDKMTDGSMMCDARGEWGLGGCNERVPLMCRKERQRI